MSMLTRTRVRHTVRHTVPAQKVGPNPFLPSVRPACGATHGDLTCTLRPHAEGTLHLDEDASRGKWHSYTWR